MRKAIHIYSVKGLLAATSYLEESLFLNNPTDQTQVGVIADTKHCTITTVAKDLIKSKATRTKSTYSTMMLTQNAKGSVTQSTIGLAGKGLHLLTLDRLISKNCNLDVLDDLVIHEEVPQSFLEYISQKPVDSI